MASLHTVNISPAALLTAVADCRFASAVIRARALLAIEFALLSHTLMNGFFFSQGFVIGFPLGVVAGWGSPAFAVATAARSSVDAVQAILFWKSGSNHRTQSPRDVGIVSVEKQPFDTAPGLGGHREAIARTPARESLKAQSLTDRDGDLRLCVRRFDARIGTG